MRGKDKIALRVGKVFNHYKMAKHFTIEITDESFTFTRNTEAIAAEAALDGIYVLRTSLPEQTLTQHAGAALQASKFHGGPSTPMMAADRCCRSWFSGSR